MNEQDFFLMRREKKITLTELAEHINCSQSLLSKYETKSCNMCCTKIRKYKDYILNK